MTLLKAANSSKPLIRRAIRPVAFYLLALLASGPASAEPGVGNTVEIKVVGSLVPPACSLALPAGGTVDYGRMQQSTLAATGNTILPEQTLGFTISCDAPAKMALLLTDEKPMTIVYDLIKAVRAESDANFMANGLGAVDGVNVGIYYVRVSAGTGDNNPGTLRTLRSDGTQGWSETPVDAPLYAHGGLAVGFSDGQATAPTAFSQVTGQLKIQTLIRPRAELPTADEIALAGSSTLTLYYQ